MKHSLCVKEHDQDERQCLIIILLRNSRITLSTKDSPIMSVNQRQNSTYNAVIDLHLNLEAAV